MPIPNEGKIEYANILAIGTWYSLSVDLISASFDPDDPDLVKADLTLGGWTGYLTNSMPTLDGAVITAGNQAKVSTISACTFVNSSGSPVTVYGFCVHNGVELYGVKAYSSPVSIPDGQTLYQLIDFYVGNLIIL